MWKHYFCLSLWVSSIYECRRVTLEDVFDYLFDVRDRKFLSEKGKKYLLELFEKKYLLELFEKWDPEHLRSDKGFDDCPDNDSLEDIIGDEDMQNLNNDD